MHVFLSNLWRKPMNKMTFVIVAALTAVAAMPSYAQDYGDPNSGGSPNSLETTSDSMASHSAENYQTYEQNGGNAPLGGYSEPLGDPAPAGAVTPGYSNGPGNGN